MQITSKSEEAWGDFSSFFAFSDSHGSRLHCAFLDSSYVSLPSCAIEQLRKRKRWLVVYLLILRSSFRTNWTYMWFITRDVNYCCINMSPRLSDRNKVHSCGAQEVIRVAVVSPSLMCRPLTFMARAKCPSLTHETSLVYRPTNWRWLMMWRP